MQARDNRDTRDFIRNLPVRDDAPGALFGCFSLAKKLGMTPGIAAQLSGHRDVYRVPAGDLRTWILDQPLDAVADAIRALSSGSPNKSPQKGVAGNEGGKDVDDYGQQTKAPQDQQGGGQSNGQGDGKSDDGQSSDDGKSHGSGDSQGQGDGQGQSDGKDGDGDGDGDSDGKDGEAKDGKPKLSDDPNLSPVQKAMQLLQEMEREVERAKTSAEAAKKEAEQAKQEAAKQAQAQAQAQQAQLPRGTSKHQDLDAVFATVKSGVPTWIAGEPGSGKTFLATQLAEALGVPLVKVAGRPDMLEADLLGSERPSTGGTWPFRPRPMLLAFAGHGEFSGGALVFIDEMDNISPAGAVAAHAFFDGSEAIYAGTDDEDRPIKWKRQENLYVLAAGNTFTGTDPDGRFQRERQDVATLSRFQMGRFWIDYDKRLERKIGAPEVVEFAHAVRKLGERNRRRSLNMSTRDIVNATKLLASGLPLDRVKESFLLGLEQTEIDNLVAERLVTKKQADQAKLACAY